MQLPIFVKTTAAFIWKKKIYAILIGGVLGVGGYFGYQQVFASETANTEYITEIAEKGALISSISGTGQVLPSSQVELKPNASGKITGLYVKNGQTVKEGQLLLQIDSRDAAINVNQANNSLASAKLALTELLNPDNTLSVTQAENSLQKAKDDLVKLKLTQTNETESTQETIVNAENSLTKAYEDAYTSTANAFLALPDIMNSLNTVLYGDDISRSETTACNSCTNDSALINSIEYTVSFDDRMKIENLIRTARNSFTTADSAFDANYNLYKNANRYSSETVLENLVSQTTDTLKKVSDAQKDTLNALDFWINYRRSHELEVFEKVASNQSSLSSDTTKINSLLSGLSSIERTIDDSRASIANAKKSATQSSQTNPLAVQQSERSIKELELKLADLRKGASTSDIATQKLAIAQRQNDLWSASQKLADYSLRAPFSGVLVNLMVNRGDTIGGSAIATLMTSQKIAEISLNEIDVAKVRVGQKAMLSFDAIEDLNISGTVAEIDSLGTVSQGVVSYTVKIAFDIQDERIKPNMTVAANIITESKNEIIVIPSSAIKTRNGNSVVQILTNEIIEDRTVVTGLTNDTQTEIISGINEGDEVITQTISTTSTSATSPNKASGGADMGGMMRIMR